jgi:hypothetical protein
MQMILDRPYDQRWTFNALQSSNHVPVELFPKPRSLKKWLSIFRVEDDMQQHVGEALRHSVLPIWNFAPLGLFDSLWQPIPGLTRPGLSNRAPWG